MERAHRQPPAERPVAASLSLINTQISAMNTAGIQGTISFGGAVGTDLSTPVAQSYGLTSTSTPSQYNAAATALCGDYKAIVTDYGIHSLDFDVEGAQQGNTPAVTVQAQAIAMLQQQEAAAGTPVTVSYTLPVLPTGLVTGQGGG